MRALQSKDLGLFSKIIAQMDVKNQLQDVFVKVDATGKTDEEIELAKEEANEKIGINLILLLVENYHKAEKDVHKLLASLNDATVKEIEELPLAEMIGMLKDLRKDDSFTAFFDLATG